MSSTKDIQLHAKSKPTFTIACTIVIVTMYAIPNRILKVLKPIKTKNRNKIVNERAKLGYFNLTIQIASVSVL